MKAMICSKYGSPDSLHLEEVEKPVPKDNELLIKVHAASVNALDWHFLRGKPFLVRLQFGFFKPKIRILGYDIAGHVEAVGKKVTQFKPGDEMFGGLGFVLGGFAEYACIAEDGFVALKPSGTTFEQAAAVPAAAVTALKGLRDKGHIKSGQKVLINGAAGGVGTFSVQIAKSFDTIVTGVCSSQKLDMVRSIGADNVIDYTKEDFTRNGQTYDLILDNVGNRTVSDLMRALNPTGRCVIVGFTSMGHMLMQSILALRVSKSEGKRILSASSEKPNREDISFLKKLLESRKVVPTIDRQYPLEQLAEAIGYVETGHARAKVVITHCHKYKTEQCIS
ncbi:MAG: NAD(P)-dependent alcohol dehydrogenase [Ignavibacteriales bacterium]|nr:NAD(P)-dependent alcohol dehydrogenase [Ignavibacteriales bacterium]